MSVTGSEWWTCKAECEEGMNVSVQTSMTVSGSPMSVSVSDSTGLERGNLTAQV